MKIANCKLPACRRGRKISNPGFTLIELLVAMAIIALLAAVLLVAMAGYGKDARASKALAQLSSAIPSVMSCWGNGGNVFGPAANGGNTICQIGGTYIDSYGKWPQKSGDLSGYTYADVSSSPLANRNWAFDFSNWAGDGKALCCNSAMNGCKIQTNNSSWICTPNDASD